MENKQHWNSQWLDENITRYVRKYLEMNLENENTIYQNLWGAMNALLGGTFMVFSTFICTKERFWINNLPYIYETEEKVEISILPYGIYRYDAIITKIPTDPFIAIEMSILKSVWDCQNNLGKEWSWGARTFNFT